jgi:hypothetical protein
MPLTAHSASVTIEENGEQHKTEIIPLDFDQQTQFVLEFSKFDGGDTAKEISFGKGKIFWAAYPLELAEDPNSSASFYNAVLRYIGLKAPFTYDPSLPAGVLVYPIELEDSVLYILESESDLDADIKLHDRATGVDLHVPLPSQHAAVVVLGKKEKNIIAKYGF